MENILINIAKGKRQEKYITPDDITDARKKYNKELVCLHFCQALGNLRGYGFEDLSLCTFVAANENVETE